MSYNSELQAAVQAAILAKARGGFVQSYTLPDGTSIATASMKELREWVEFLDAEVAKEAGSGSISLAVLRPFR